MTVRRLCLTVCAVGLQASVTASAPRAGAPPAPLAAVDSLLTAALDERHVPGLAVVVLRGEDTVLARGYGRIEAGRPEPVRETTVFQLGSIGKQFLAALVVALAGEGRLSLGDPVTRHLTGFPLLPPAMRVRHLLSHTSGLRELFMLPEAQNGFDDLSRTREELHAAVRRAPVDFAPGSRWAYSNSNYTLLAMLVERLTGKPYERVLAERIFQPLGLSSFRQCASVPSGLEARGHEWQDGQARPAAPENMEWIRGDGGLCGSALDLARWTSLLATGRVLGPRPYAEMTAPTRLDGGGNADYGFALSLVRMDGRAKVAHNGAMRGFSASAAYYPDAALTVVVLANRGDVRTESLERAIARRLFGLPEPEVRETALPAADRGRFAGTYDIGVFGLDLHVVDREGRLWLEMPRPAPTTALRYLGGGEFVGADDPEACRLTFTGGDGPTPRVRLFMAAMHWYGVRRSEPRAP
jgi:CubicO group peptidase (beta-lactamase class C family)